MKLRPFGYAISEMDAKLSPFDNHIERRLSALRNQFSDQKACQAMIDTGDPVIYEVFENHRPNLAGELLSGLSVVHAGTVGNEYYMTKGHYHEIRETAEIYYCLKGKGLLVMEDESGDTAVEELSPDRVVYVTPRWAHRSINTGEVDLVTFFVYPGHAGHDYSTIEAKGFRKRVINLGGIPETVDTIKCAAPKEMVFDG